MTKHNAELKLQYQTAIVHRDHLFSLFLFSEGAGRDTLLGCRIQTDIHNDLAQMLILIHLLNHTLLKPAKYIETISLATEPYMQH